MKSLHQHAVEFYGLEKDERQNTPRWRAMQPILSKLEKLLTDVVEESLFNYSKQFSSDDGPTSHEVKG